MGSETARANLHRSPNLANALSTLRNRRIACVGDVMLDVEVACGQGRISPEAPVLVFAEQEHQARLGGTGNVAANVASLGCATSLFSLVGHDTDGLKITELLSHAGIGNGVVRNANVRRPTTRKTRFVCDGQQLLRVDREIREPLDCDEAEHLISALNTLEHRLDGILVSDYAKGVVTLKVMTHLHKLAAKHGCFLLVDPKGTDWNRYGAVDIVKPNASELEALSGLPCRCDAEVEQALRRALNKCAAKAILVTRAAAGASLIVREDGCIRHYDGQRVDVADVCGAGDTNLATLGAMLAAGLGLDAAIEIAQLASSLAVQRHGNAVISASELWEASNQSTSSRSPGRVLDRDELLQQVELWRAQGLRIGMTNGCFDLLHSGHVRSLEFLKQHCDRVIVALNSNASVRRLKGETRPIIDEQDRAAVVAGLGAVDAVAFFDDDTPDEIIEQIRPNVLCKGGDYDPQTMAGAKFVQANGGKTVVCDLKPGISTSVIIENIRKRVFGDHISVLER